MKYIFTVKLTCYDGMQKDNKQCHEMIGWEEGFDSFKLYICL